MKCPKCGTDVTGKRNCSKCGLDIAGFQEEIEVEYKDFKTSELLEIRRKKQAASGHEEIKTLREQHEGKAKDEKKPFFFLVAMALILMLIVAGAFFIFRYFIMR